MKLTEAGFKEVLPSTLFLLESQTADLSRMQLNNIASSTKRFDLVLRSITTTLFCDKTPDPRFGIWCFFPQPPDAAQKQNALFFQRALGYNSLLTIERQLAELLAPLVLTNEYQEKDLFPYANTEIAKAFETDKKLDLNTLFSLFLFRGTIFDSLKWLAQKGYSFIILDEEGEAKYLEEKLELDARQVFIIGDKDDWNREIIPFFDTHKIEYQKISLGPLSYLASTCITLVKMHYDLAELV